MFSTICFIISIIGFIATFGCHMILKNENSAAYLDSPLICSIPWISGFILAVIPECIIFSMSWYWMFLINLAFTYILGPLITNLFLRMFASGKGIGRDGFTALMVGIITLIVGLIFR